MNKQFGYSGGIVYGGIPIERDKHTKHKRIMFNIKIHLTRALVLLLAYTHVLPYMNLKLEQCCRSKAQPSPQEFKVLIVLGTQ